jgi:hypothetical protein
MAQLVLNPQSNEISISTANTINNGTFVRVFNTSASPQVATLKYANGAQYANVTILATSYELFYKLPTSTIAGTSLVALQVQSQSRTPV